MCVLINLGSGGFLVREKYSSRRTSILRYNNIKLKNCKKNMELRRLVKMATVCSGGQNRDSIGQMETYRMMKYCF